MSTTLLRRESRRPWSSCRGWERPRNPAWACRRARLPGNAVAGAVGTRERAETGMSPWAVEQEGEECPRSPPS